MDVSPAAELPRRTKSRRSVLQLRSELERCIKESTPARPPALAPLSDLSNSPRLASPPANDATSGTSAPAAPPPATVDLSPANGVEAPRPYTTSPCVSARRRRGHGQSPISASQAISFVSQMLAQAQAARATIQQAAEEEEPAPREESIRRAADALLDLCTGLEAQRDAWLCHNRCFIAPPATATPLANAGCADQTPVRVGPAHGPTGTPAAGLCSRSLAVGPDESVPASPVRPPALLLPGSTRQAPAGSSAPAWDATGEECDRAATALQAVARGNQARRATADGMCAVRVRAAAALAFVSSEREYKRRLVLLHAGFYAPLAAAGVPPAALRPVFGNVQVLLNLSEMMLSELVKQQATEPTTTPSAACARALLAMLPMFRVYQQYVGGRSAAVAALGALREGQVHGAEAARRLAALEAAAAAPIDALSAVGGGHGTAAATTLDDLLDAPSRRLACYASHLARILKATADDGRARPAVAQALGFCSDLVAQLDASLAEQASRLHVAELHGQLSRDLGTRLRAVLPEGLALPHRRFLREGQLALASDAGAPRENRAVYLFNDILLLVVLGSGAEPGDVAADAGGDEGVSSGGRAGGVGEGAAVECINLAKVQIKILPDIDETGGGPGQERAGFYPFELWSITRSWRLAATSEAERAEWAEAIQQQVRFLLAAFKQRGRSLAFLPDTVNTLRSRLAVLHTAQRRHEAEVHLLTDEMCQLDARLQADRAALAAASFRGRRLSLAVPSRLAGPASARQIQGLRLRVTRSAHERAELQRVAHGCVERLLQTLTALEETDDCYNDDSLIQYMLFSKE